MWALLLLLLPAGGGAGVVAREGAAVPGSEDEGPAADDDAAKSELAPSSSLRISESSDSCSSSSSLAETGPLRGSARRLVSECNRQWTLLRRLTVDEIVLLETADAPALPLLELGWHEEVETEGSEAAAGDEINQVVVRKIHRRLKGDRMDLVCCMCDEMSCTSRNAPNTGRRRKPSKPAGSAGRSS